MKIHELKILYSKKNISIFVKIPLLCQEKAFKVGCVGFIAWLINLALKNNAKHMKRMVLGAGIL